MLEPEPPFVELARRRHERVSSRGRSGGAAHAVQSPMQGTVLDVRVEQGERVVEGDVICIVEAMKMENEIRAHQGGLVTQLTVVPGQAVAAGHVVCTVEPEQADA